MEHGDWVEKVLEAQIFALAPGDRDTVIKTNLYQSIGYPMFMMLFSKYKDEISREGLISLIDNMHFELMNREEIQEMVVLEEQPIRTICGYDEDIEVKNGTIDRDVAAGKFTSHYGMTFKGDVVYNPSEDTETITLD